MKLTKYGHACLLLEKDSAYMLIDPGSFTELPAGLPKIDFVIVTEEHYDHFNPDNLEMVARANPDVQIYTTTAVQEKLKDADLHTHAVTGDKTISLGAFEVAFSETDHAVVYQKSPCKSLAIMVDGDALYYPSDSYKTIDTKVKVLALPTSGPWFKVSECIEFANAVDSDIVIPTHNGLNSDNGHKVTHNFVVNSIDSAREFVFLTDGESIEVK
ncbi:MAG: MBL fold metallo-hydrolase [Candidatus Saccharimonadales bacterium]